MDKLLPLIIVFLLIIAPISSARAVSPPYQQNMERLSELMGALYFLQPLCGYNNIDWRSQAAKLIELEKATNNRKQRLIGFFNDGYQSFARIYHSCTPSAKEAMMRYLFEAKESAKYIHTQFAE